MNNRLLISTAAAALIAGMSFAGAQSPGGGNAGGGAGGGAGGAAGSSSQSGAPAASPSGDRGGAMNRDGGGGAMNRDGGSMNRDNAPRDNATDQKGSDTGAKSTQTDQKDGVKGEKAAQSKEGGKDGKNMRSEDRNDGAKNADSKDGAKGSADNKTTGQAGAGGKLSSEQRTKFTATIKQQNIRPETNVNFNISIGTRVPREVRFHPLPTEIISVYPDWRGYEFFLVGNDIIVVNPRTLEIVAVLDA